ncbi:exodeoxyribonuclease V subunit gamma [Larsenimonas rhizosphaerae]|uniref:exodeoxyribonuclease V subunit gamma n=1 Tax=Larsenimonas rhizosphaerae TaxID=2944682 RepID=UPI002034052F|nr:exodeoxyribonuclease V subunit gamma [Larsenimonas rhizosphaerae]MCM2130307.1 exodeoxyribonuclease V subunit gamma [Larsenimonas rhizosphaerae]
MFTVVHANHVEDLRDLALSLVARQPLPPLDDETFIVQSNGMAQWLKLGLADALGVAASTDFPMPSSFAWRAYRAVLGDDIPDQSPFDKPALTWRIMRLLPAYLEVPAFAPLRHYLKGERYPHRDVMARKQYQLAAQLADLFDQYLVYRPGWMAAWAANETLPADMTEEEQWQPALWRALMEDAPEALRDQHRAALHTRFIARAATLERIPDGLPARVFVFGVSSLPRQVLEVLHALSGVMEVVLLMTNPCRFYWGDVIADRDVLRREFKARRHQNKPGLADLAPEALHLHANPLLASWGTQGRDFLVSLYDFETHNPFSIEEDVFRDRIEAGSLAHAPLLHQLQQDVLDLVHPSEHVQAGQKRTVAQDDDSISLIVTHSPLREVEVLRDRLLAAFEAQPDLMPRDIIVMVPDINAYAPFIKAVFGQISPDQRDYIPYTIADQQASQADPLLMLVLSLLQLPDQRLGVSRLLDWLDVPAFRRRVRIEESELPLLRRWLEQSGVRWGLNGAHRERLGLPGLAENTWAFGLKRMLLGYASGEGEAFNGIEPYADVAGIDAALAGRLAMLLDRLDALATRLMTSRAPADWQRVLDDVLATLLAPETPGEWMIVERVQQAVTRWCDECRCAGFDDPLPAVVVHDALASSLDEGGLAQRFLAGKVNFATLMPMRAIPFREVVLLGMNDGDYPRSRLPQDFDMMARRPLAGDRSRRDDDRYLFLEALLSARDRLTLSWVGHDQRDNSERTPSVLINELMDTLRIGWCAWQGGAVVDQLTTCHPLQPFSRRYFDPADPLWTYDQQWARIHRPHAPASSGGLAAGMPEARLRMEDLERLMRQPMGVCVQQRLGIGFQAPSVPEEDREPFGLNGLDVHQIKQSLLDSAEQGEALATSMARWVRRGELPAEGFGDRWAQTLLAPVEQQWAHWCGVMESLTLTGDVVLNECLTVGGIALTLRDRRDDIRQDPDGRRWLWQLAAGHYSHFRHHRDGRLDRYGKAHRLYSGWLWQQWLAASGESVHLGVLFEDRALTLPPPTLAVARERCQTLMTQWLAAWQSPLPTASELALLWWSRQPVGDDASSSDEARWALHEQLTTLYEEGVFNGLLGLRQRQPAMGELWPSMNHLLEAGFEHATRALYGDFWSDLSTRVEQSPLDPSS